MNGVSVYNPSYGFEHWLVAVVIVFVIGAGLAWYAGIWTAASLLIFRVARQARAHMDSGTPRDDQTPTISRARRELEAAERAVLR